MENSEASLVTGEGNELLNGHGSFITGGHNKPDGGYNVLIGQHLTTDPSATSSSPFDFPTRMIMGERINSNLNYSLTVGLNRNRTTVTTERGMALQLNPSTVSFPAITYAPTVNFEVDGGVTGAPALAMPSLIRSNIRFHNLPDTRDRLLVIMVDPTTGELFIPQNDYSNPMMIGGDSSESMMIQKLEESVKEQQLQIQNQQK